MHGEAWTFLERLRSQHPRFFTGSRVLECGSYDINGTVRQLFTDAEYTGIDWRDGPGVDAVSLVHEYQPAQAFDLVLSTEMLEHDPYWHNSLGAMCGMVAPGGALALTWASPERHKHEVDCAPQADYYLGLSAHQVLAAVQAAGRWHTVEARTTRGGLDCQLFAMKPAVSVVIAAMGQPALTACCISEVRRLATSSLEVVLVDNGSKPEESALLEKIRPDVYLHSADPLGYAAANNRGVEASTGRYVVLLNNDAWPTRRGWDTRLASVLEGVPNAGLVAGTMPRVWHPEQAANGPQAEGAELVEADRLSFVAVMLRRETWDTIGTLDERFGAGNFEDDDYCHRLGLAEKRVLIDPACFFFHVGSVTMSTLDYAGLMARNRQLFEEKWNAETGTPELG